MVNPMLRPDVFGGLATHAGDALFEMCYLPEFRKSVRALRDHYDGSFERFWEDFRCRPALAKDSDHTLLNDYCMAACYSADEDGTVQLPYDTDTGELRPEIWERWLAWDPVRMAPKHADALRSLKAIYIDCGKRDQFFLDLGRRGVPARARGDRRDGLLLRALRRDALGDRVPLPARDRRTWPNGSRDPRRCGPRAASHLPRPRPRDAARGRRQVEPVGPGSRMMKIKDGGGAAGEAAVALAIARRRAPTAARARLPGGDDAHGADHPARRRRRQHRAGTVLQPAARGADGADPRRRFGRPSLHGVSTLVPAWHRGWTDDIYASSLRAPAGRCSGRS